MSDLMKGTKIASGMFWRLGEKFTAQAVSFCVSIVLARLVLPDDYGAVAIINIFISIAEIFVTSGISTSLIQKRNVSRVEFSTIFYCGFVLSIALYGIIFFLAIPISSFYDMPILKPLLRVLALKLPISAVNSVQNAYVSREMDFKKFFLATLVGTVISAIVGILMALKGFGVWALIAQYLTNSAIDTAVLFVVVKWRPTLQFSKEAAKPLLSYGWKILATDLIGQTFNQINAIIIGKKYTAADLAYYSQGKRIPEMLDNNICNTLSAVLFPALSQQDSKERIVELRRKSLKMLSYVMCPLMFGVAAVADNMILVLLTDKWRPAVYYVRISSVNTIIGIMGATLIQEIKAIGRSDVTLKLEIIKKPLFLVIVFVSMFFGVKGVACSLLINSTLAFIFNVIPVKKYIGFNFKMHIIDMAPSFVMSGVMGIIVYLVQFLVNDKWICLLIQVVIGMSVYIGLSYLTKNESFLYILTIIKKFIGGDRK